MFKVTVTEFVAHDCMASEPLREIIRYEQTVDVLNLRALLNVVNTTPRVRRKKGEQEAKAAPP